MTWLISTWAEQQCPFGPNGNKIFEQTREKSFPNSEPIACFEGGGMCVICSPVPDKSPQKQRVEVFESTKIPEKKNKTSLGVLG